MTLCGHWQLKMDNFLNLANRLYEVLVGNLSTIECWGFYLFDSEFDSEPELRNKIGVIWFCSLIDSIEAQSRFLPQIAREAEEQGFDSLVENSKQLQNFCTLIAEFLGKFSREEQIFLNNLRNQWVHSYFAMRHREKILVKYCAKGELLTEELTSAEYSEVTRPFFENGKSLDETLATIISRMLDSKEHRYWYALEAWQKDHEAIYEVFRNGDTIKIDV